MDQQKIDLIQNAYVTIRNLVQKSKDTSVPEALKSEFIEAFIPNEFKEECKKYIDKNTY